MSVSDRACPQDPVRKRHSFLPDTLPVLCRFASFHKNVGNEHMLRYMAFLTRPGSATMLLPQTHGRALEKFGR